MENVRRPIAVFVVAKRKTRKGADSRTTMGRRGMRVLFVFQMIIFLLLTGLLFVPTAAKAGRAEDKAKVRAQQPTGTPTGQPLNQVPPAGYGGSVQLHPGPVMSVGQATQQKLRNAAADVITSLKLEVKSGDSFSPGPVLVRPDCNFLLNAPFPVRLTIEAKEDIYVDNSWWWGDFGAGPHMATTDPLRTAVHAGQPLVVNKDLWAGMLGGLQARQGRRSWTGWVEFRTEYPMAKTSNRVNLTFLCAE